MVHDTVEFVNRMIEVELNSATDNPMIFTETDNVTLAMQAPEPAAKASIEEHATVRDDEPRDGELTPFKRPTDTFYKVEQMCDFCPQRCVCVNFFVHALFFSFVSFVSFFSSVSAL